jgi:hypothetical protein
MLEEDATTSSKSSGKQNLQQMEEWGIPNDIAYIIVGAVGEMGELTSGCKKVLRERAGMVQH